MQSLLKHNMTHSIVSVKQSTKAKDAHVLMVNQLIRHLPVVDESGEVIVGMLSDRDLLRTPNPDQPVDELMSSPILTFDIQTPMRSVVTAMIDQKVSAFLVTEDSEVVGIVTSEDMLLLLSQVLKDEESPKWVLSEFLVNPLLQQSMNMTAQAGL